MLIGQIEQEILEGRFWSYWMQANSYLDNNEVDLINTKVNFGDLYAQERYELDNTQLVASDGIKVGESVSSS